MQLVVAGRANKQIAAELRLSRGHREGPPRPGHAQDAGKIRR